MKPLTPTTPETSSTPEAPKAPTPPETYTFKAPEGKTYDQALIDSATPIFKELGLDQAAADKLVAFYDKHAQTSADLAIKAVNTMRADWRDQVSKDPEMGSRLEQVKADVGRLKNTIFSGDPDGLKAYNDAVDLTGAGDHPAIIRAMWKLAKALNEGQHVTGSSPSKEGQKPPNTSSRPPLASAIWPNLARE